MFGAGTVDWDMESSPLVQQSACPLDCPDACTLRIERDAAGGLVKVGGDQRNPLTGGFICAKVAGIGAHLDCPERLQTPLLRDGPKGSGRFVPTDWDTALDRIATRFGAIAAEHGAEAIVPCSYGGSNGMLTEGGFDARFFGRLGASQLARTLCAIPSSLAQKGLYGRMPGGALHDVVHSRLVVVWGCNPSATSIHFLRLVRQARKAGAKVVVVDPVRIPLAAQADLHLAIRPGTDVVLALALAHWMFENGAADAAFLAAHATGVAAFRRRAARWSLPEAAAECGVPVAQIAALARLYADSSPAMIRCGWGPERNRNGGSGTAAVLALPAIGGKFGVRGGGYQMSNSGAWGFDAAAAADAPSPSTRTINLSRMGPALNQCAGPPIAGLYVYDANPLMTCPDQEAMRRGLLREDLFTVVHDAVMTDTALLADVVLPATTFLEHHDLARGYGALSLNRVVPVVAGPPQARSNGAVFVALCDRMGLSRPTDVCTPQALAERLVAAHPDAARIQADLDRDGRAGPPCGDAPVAFVDVFPGTPDRKIHLVPGALESEAPLGLYGYQADPRSAAAPLALISPAVPGLVSSTFGQLRTKPAALRMHPADAGARGLQDGQDVRVFNDQGEVHCALAVDGDVRPGVVVLAKGLWARHTDNGRTSNALIPPTLSDIGGGACYNDARVQVAARR